MISAMPIIASGLPCIVGQRRRPVADSVRVGDDPAIRPSTTTTTLSAR